MEEKKAFVVDINSEKNYQRLIPGAPVTHGLKSGRVYLEPGADCGRHNTEEKEEQLVFLSGSGTAEIAGEKLEVGAGKICYIPPQTEHNIINTGQEPLIYIFTTAAASGETGHAHKKHEHKLDKADDRDREHKHHHDDPDHEHHHHHH